MRSLTFGGRSKSSLTAVVFLAAWLSRAASPAPITPDMIQNGSDIPVKWARSAALYDYDRRELMIPMRDGVTLHTVIMVPKTAHDLPILLDRTPYEASGSTFFNDSLHLRDAVLPAFREFSDDGYIFVLQDIRGKYGSGGNYVMTRPPIGPLNPSNTDDTTDAYDTIEWLIKNVPESNGRVGMIGSSYDGWAVAMALLGPHPALKVAAPESPMIDGWMGDDWFHYGAFRERELDYFARQFEKKGSGDSIPRSGADDYQNFLEAGSAGNFANRGGLRQIGFWNRLSAHPAYDAFYQEQALDKLLAAKPSTVPTMWVQGLWDQEDIYGAITTWEALRAKGKVGNNHLVMGPWYHSQAYFAGDTLGPFKWKGDTAADFRKTMLVPFFDTYLKDRKPGAPTPQVLIYNAADNHWDSFTDWPGTRRRTALYLQAENGLAFHTAAGGEDQYVSDPAKPVPFLPPPVSLGDRARWNTWLVQDQRFVTTRPDVLSYQSPILDTAVIVQGAPLADIFANTTGTDADFVVKIIDVYPSMVAEQPELGGYQLAISMDIFRGRYRESFERPGAIPAGRVQEYKFRLPTVNYVFKPGHRIMVQIQSSLFPIYDRNPQSFVDNIFFAKPTDYRKATVTIEHGAAGPSAVLLPVVTASSATRQRIVQRQLE